MANRNHLDLLKQGIVPWNQWRNQNTKTQPNLQGADLEGLVLSGANLANANLRGANLCRAFCQGTSFKGADLRYAGLNHGQFNKSDFKYSNLSNASLSKAMFQDTSFTQADCSYVDFSYSVLPETSFHAANLFYADLHEAYLWRSVLINANLNHGNLGRAELHYSDCSKADFSEADLSLARFEHTILAGVDLRKAHLSGTDLTYSNLVGAIIEDAFIDNCRIYGASIWDLKGIPARQTNLVITAERESTIMVDSLEVAQFIYLLLDNHKISNILDTVASKVVLILGRFSPRRKLVLDTIRDALRERGYIPVLFDFDKPSSQDYIEPISTLAHMSRFVIADITDPKIVLEELPHIVRNIAVPVKPLLLEGSGPEPVTIYNLRRFQPFWLLDTHIYKDIPDLLSSIEEKIIAPAEAKALEKFKDEG